MNASAPDFTTAMDVLYGAAVDNGAASAPNARARRRQRTVEERTSVFEFQYEADASDGDDEEYEGAVQEPVLFDAFDADDIAARLTSIKSLDTMDQNCILIPVRIALGLEPGTVAEPSHPRDVVKDMNALDRMVFSGKVGSLCAMSPPRIDPLLRADVKGKGRQARSDRSCAHHIASLPHNNSDERDPDCSVRWPHRCERRQRRGPRRHIPR